VAIAALSRSQSRHSQQEPVQKQLQLQPAWLLLPAAKQAKRQLQLQRAGRDVTVWPVEQQEWRWLKQRHCFSTQRASLQARRMRPAAAAGDVAAAGQLLSPAAPQAIPMAS
jgi:hypothetical protein